MLVYVIVDNPTVSEDESVSAGLAIKIEKMVMESIIPYMNTPYQLSDTEPETTTIAEETSATEASTDSEEESGFSGPARVPALMKWFRQQVI